LDGKYGDNKDMKKHILTASMALGLIFFIWSCTGHLGYGKLRVQRGHDGSVTTETLRENWQEYAIYYAGLSVKNPSGVMFDPKNDNKKLISDKWIRIKNQDTLADLIHWLDANIKFYPVLYRILGPDDEFYGYLYTAWDHVHIKAVDENTLWVDDLPMPPTDYGPGRADRVGGRNAGSLGLVLGR